MRGVVVASALGLAGCNSLVGSGPFEQATCFGSFVEICLVAPPVGDLVLSSSSTGPDIDTDGDSRCANVVQPTTPLCVMAGVTVTVGSTSGGPIIAMGSRPLVLIGADTVTFRSELDVSSYQTSTSVYRGAGANSSECMMADGATGTTEGGGGAGGSFGSRGGNGAASKAGTAGGDAGPTMSAGAIRGGCRGGDGGGRLSGRTMGGWSGGAVYVIAGHTITIDTSAAIYASGEGGRGGGAYFGGGGGGTGGLIALDARMISMNGTLAANGGGGGGGGDLNPGTDGQHGSAPFDSLMYSTPAAGGMGPAIDQGGIGGKGAALDMAATAGATPAASGGGGGGGGGAGVIWIHGELQGTKISPAPIRN